MEKSKRSWYFRGVGVGLLISWVTGALAYLVAGTSTLPALVGLEFVVSVACFAVAYLTR